MSEEESGQVSEQEKEAIEKLTIKAITSSAEAPNFPNSIVMKKDLQILLNYIDKLQKENQKLKEENEKINKVADKMYEYISYYGWEDFESNTGCNREEMVDYFYKE